MHENNSNDCTDDGVSCTIDVCEQGVCQHPSDPNNPCATVVKILGNTLMMDSTRTFVRLDNQGYLVFGAGPDDAELFEVTTVEGTTIVLRAMTTGHFVGVDLEKNDYLVANVSNIEEATDIDSAPCMQANGEGAACAPACRGLEVFDDDDNERFVAAEVTCPTTGECVALGLRARSPECSASQFAWEAWEFVPQ
jgi:hypothetical protein